ADHAATAGAPSPARRSGWAREHRQRRRTERTPPAVSAEPRRARLGRLAQRAPLSVAWALACMIGCVVIARAAPARAETSNTASDTLAAVRERSELVWGGDIQGGEPYVFEDPRD